MPRGADNGDATRIVTERRRFYIAPMMAMNAAVNALKDYLISEGMEDLASLDVKTKRVVDILYHEDRDREPGDSRTLAFISFYLCNVIGLTHRHLADHLRESFVQQTVEFLEIAWNHSEEFSEMDEYENNNFLFRTNTVADMYALGLVTPDQFNSALDNLVPKVKDANLFAVALLEFISRGLTHRSNKIPGIQWQKLYLRLRAIPRNFWRVCPSNYDELCQAMHAFEEDANREYIWCTIPFSETAECESHGRLERICCEIMAEATGSSDVDQQTISIEEIMQHSILETLTRDVSIKYTMPPSQYHGPPWAQEPIHSRLAVTEEAAINDGLTSRDVYHARLVLSTPQDCLRRVVSEIATYLAPREKELRSGDLLKKRANNFIEAVFTLLFSESGPMIDAAVLAEICSSVHDELDKTQENKSIAGYLNLLWNLQAMVTLDEVWDVTFEDWNNAMEDETLIVTESSFNDLRKISAFYSSCYHFKLIETAKFNAMAYGILEKYTSECLELLMVLVVDILSRGLMSGFSYALIFPEDLWEQALKQMKELVGEDEDTAFHDALPPFRAFIEEFLTRYNTYRLPNRSRARGFVPFRLEPPPLGTEEDAHLRELCSELVRILRDQQ
ncbi:hypothetical protein NMY22_g5892 [Coprinellus aureogranulatus]|nr:hypothetical protein NMY22_g5892 [Coprinellus aureogranulatus]